MPDPHTPTEPSPAPNDALSAIVGLRPFLAGRTLSALSAQVLAVAVAWQTYALTHSVAALGLIGLAQFLPMLALVFISGHVPIAIIASVLCRSVRQSRSLARLPWRS